ncbi:porin [Thalassospira sp. MCCC 1A03138]|uniref:porin n=1 Tax=Thalassospira sp. MCCC 1A03138 TaxID=1470576 RepID=UPI000A1E86E1|nr:porin [Thalassospira sp. MCCC 1A03138]OSQ31689.1 porin [Thalassospira sp. MCCC 1A03138]
MKKILFASSAIVAVAFAGQASASEPIKLSVGGYMEQWAGFADQDLDSAGGRVNAFQSDTEVYFTGSTTLDNGIEIGARIELEGETSTDQVDEQFLFVNGGFGRIEMGKNDSAADAMGVTAPSVGPVGPNDGGMEDWVNMTVIDTVPSSGDQNRVTYYTPNFGGFQAGVSFADNSQTNGSLNVSTTAGSQSIYASDTSGNGDNVLSAAVAYSNDFDGFSLGLSLEGENQGEGNWYGVGANVGFGNFTVGGSYGRKEDDYGLSSRNSTTGLDDTDAFDLGVSYAMDAASVSATYAYQETGSTETQGAALGLSYTLGAGVAWQSSVFWFDDDKAGAASDNDGYGAVTGLKLSF